MHVLHQPAEEQYQSNYVSHIALKALLSSSRAGIDRGYPSFCLLVSFNIILSCVSVTLCSLQVASSFSNQGISYVAETTCAARRLSQYCPPLLLLLLLLLSACHDTINTPQLNLARARPLVHLESKRKTDLCLGAFLL